MEEVKTDVKDMELRDFAKGKTRFTISADDTLENMTIHESFKEFCRIETDNNYTQGIRKLLEYYQGDFKYEMLFNKLEEQNVVLSDLKGSIIELTKKKEVKKDDQDEEDTGAF